jgi:hypothetical protein
MRPFITVKKMPRLVSSSLKQVAVRGKIGKHKFWHARLSLAQKLTWPAQL